MQFGDKQRIVDLTVGTQEIEPKWDARGEFAGFKQIADPEIIADPSRVNAAISVIRRLLSSTKGALSKVGLINLYRRFIFNLNDFHIMNQLGVSQFFYSVVNSAAGRGKQRVNVINLAIMFIGKFAQLSRGIKKGASSVISGFPGHDIENIGGDPVYFGAKHRIGERVWETYSGIMLKKMGYQFTIGFIQSVAFAIFIKLGLKMISIMRRRDSLLKRYKNSKNKKEILKRMIVKELKSLRPTKRDAWWIAGLFVVIIGGRDVFITRQEVLSLANIQ